MDRTDRHAPYRRLLEASGDLFCILDRDGRIVDANAAWRESLGWSAEELSGRPYAALVHPQDRAAGALPALPVGDADPTAPFRNRCRSKTGRYRWFEWRATALDTDGALCATGRDIDRPGRRDARAMEQVEALLHERSTRLDQLLSECVAVVYAFDPETERYPYLASGFEALTGVAAGDLVSGAASWRDIVHPDDIEGVVARAGSWLAQGAEDILVTQFRIRRRDGAVRWIEDRARYRRHADGRPNEIVGSLTDVTGRVEAAQATAASQATLAATIAALPDVLFEVDGTGRILAMSLGAENTEVIAPERLVGRTLSEAFPPDVARIGEAAIRDAAETGVSRGHVYALDAQGRQHWYELSVSRKETAGESEPRFVALAREITDRRNMAEALERERTLFRKVFENIDAAMFIKRRDGRFVAANRRFLQLWDIASVAGLTDRDFLPGPFADAMAARDQAFFESGRPDSIEIEIAPPGGRRFMLFSRFLIPEPETGEMAMCGVAADVTELRRRESEAQRARDRLQKIFDNSGVSMFVKRRDGCIVMANEAYRGSLDAPLEPLQPDPRAAQFAATDDRVFETGLPFAGEETVGDGAAARTFLVSKFLIPDPEIDDAALCSVAVDVTELRRREIDLARMSARFEGVFENSDTLMMLKRRDGSFLAANRRFLIDIGAETVEGLHDRHIAAVREAPELAAHDEAVFATGVPFSGEEGFTTPDGLRRTYLSYKFLIDDPVLDEKVLCTLATDITEIKRLQNEAEENRRLAEQAAQAKSQFLATMSHEIRTPMNGVIGMADLLAQSGLDESQQRMLGVIRQSGETLMAVINDILDVSKIESGRIVLEATPFRPSEVVEHVRGLIAPRARAHRVTTAYDIDPGGTRLRLGDAHRIGQILLNLLSNAVKFAEGGNVWVRLRAPPSAPVTIEIEDDGIGMDEEQAARVFERFAQADASTTRRFGGTGLGLSIVRGLADAMGATVELDTAPGLGSTFRVILPLPEARDSVPDASAPARPQQIPPELHVLAADDNEVNRVVLSAMLDALGVRHRMVSGGREAVVLAREGGFDLLLLDISMPDMDGQETLAAIRREAAQRGAPYVPAIAVTANALREQVAAYRKAGFDDHLAKPIRQSDLAAVLGRWPASGQGTGRSARSPAVVQQVPPDQV